MIRKLKVHVYKNENKLISRVKKTAISFKFNQHSSVRRRIRESWRRSRNSIRSRSLTWA